MALDPNAQQATILPTESEGIISFAKGERQYKDSQNFYEQQERAKRRAAGAKGLKTELDKLGDVEGDPWAYDLEYTDNIRNQYLDKWSSEIPTIHQQNGGTIPPEVRRLIDKDQQLYNQSVEMSKQHKFLYDKAALNINKEAYNTPDNRRSLREWAKPIEHAERTGNMKEYEELGPVGYREKNLNTDLMLESKYNAAEYFDKTYGDDIKKVLLNKTDNYHTNAMGGNSRVKTEELRLSDAIDYISALSDSESGLEEHIMGTVNKTMSSRYDLSDPAQLEVARSKVIESIAGIYAYDKRTTLNQSKANPNKDKDFTMRYISNKGGKSTLTQEFRDAAIFDQPINSGGRTGNTPIQMATPSLKVNVPTGGIRDFDSGEVVGDLGNYILGQGTLYWGEGSKVMWSGQAKDADGDTRDIVLDANNIDHPMIREAQKAMEYYVENEWEPIKSSSKSGKPKFNGGK